MNQETTKGIFNKLAGSYDTPERQVIAGIIHEELARRVEDIPHEAVLLDYGCGTGLMSLPFADGFSKLFLVDIAEEMVEQVEKKCKDLGLSNVKAQKLDVFQAGSQKADLILVIQTLLHIPDTDQILQDLSQRLTENGRMIIVDFLKNDEVVSDLVHSGFTESDLTIRCQQHRLVLADFQPFYTGDKLFMGKTATLFVAVIQQGKQSKISL